MNKWDDVEKLKKAYRHLTAQIGIADPSMRIGLRHYRAAINVLLARQGKRGYIKEDGSSAFVDQEPPITIDLESMSEAGLASLFDGFGPVLYGLVHGTIDVDVMGNHEFAPADKVETVMVPQEQVVDRRFGRGLGSTPLR